MAEPIKEGQYANMWKLKEGWRVGVKGEMEGEDKMELELDPDDDGDDGDDFEEDEEDDADLEEVLMS